MNEKETKFLLDVFERFGDKAQQALDFMRRNQNRAETRPENCDAIAAGKEAPLELLPNGVYLVYPDKTFAPYSKDAKVVPDTRVGISWDGHRWLMGNDYGNLMWTKASEGELGEYQAGIMTEYEAVLDWDVYPMNVRMRKFFKHIPFTSYEMMPTCPMVLVMEYLASLGLLNAALKVCGQEEYETEADRWLVERSDVNGARYFNGDGGYIGSTTVSHYYRVQAVTLW